MRDSKNSHGTSNPHLKDPSLSVVLKILANDQRRKLLQYLKEQPEEVVSLQDLVEHLQSSETPSKQIHLSLVHCHLPRLEKNGLIKFNRSQEAVHYKENSRLDALLNFLEKLK